MQQIKYTKMHNTTNYQSKIQDKSTNKTKHNTHHKVASKRKTPHKPLLTQP